MGRLQAGAGAGVKVLNAFVYALEGLVLAWQRERNFRIEVAMGAAALAAAFWLGVDPLPVVLVSALVLGLELINTALEAVVDLVTPEHHPLAKRAKDTAAAAVLVAALASVFVGVWLFLPALLRRFAG